MEKDIDIKRILRRISRYLIEYRHRNAITQHEMAAMIGLSISRYSEIERNMGHNGLSLKTILVIAQLEHDSLSEFFLELEGRALKSGLPKKDYFSSQLEKVNKPVKVSFIKKVQKDDAQHKNIPNKLRWSLELLNLILEGKHDQLEEIETFILTYYLSHIGRNPIARKAVKSRLVKLVRGRQA